MVMFSTLFVVSAIIVHVYGLSSSKTPGGNFALSKWKITLPDSSASEKSPSQLEGGYTSKYFYTASDGSMTFYVKGNGGKTENAKYPRSELRQLCNPSKGDRYNWAVSSGYNYVDGKYKIGKLDSSSRKIVIQQIHAYDAPPLVKIQWQSGKVHALVKTDKSGNNEKKYTLGSVSQYTYFTLKTVVSSGYLKIYFNGSRKTNINVKSFWSSYKNYFKAGNYLQSSSSSAYAYIHIYSLTVSTASSNCKYTSSSFTYDEESETATNTAVIVAVMCIFLVLITGAVCGFCYWRKKKQAGEVSFKADEDSNKGGDTPIADGDSAADTPDTTGGYDMNEIEINVEVDAEGDKNEETQQ